MLKNDGSLVLWDKDLNVMWNSPASSIIHTHVAGMERLATVDYPVKSVNAIFGDNPSRHVNSSRKILQQLGYSMEQLNSEAL